MSFRSHVTRFALGLGLVLLVQAPAYALSVPSAEDQEVLIKNTLVTFNDANQTGNYTVMHAKASKPFRTQISPDKLKETFKGFGENDIDLSDTVSKPVKSTKAAIEDDTLILEGTIALGGEATVTYALKYIQSDGEWKLIGINVKKG